MRFVAGWALLALLAPALASAEPLDLSDPTPRTIRVQFEISADPASIGQTYSEAFAASYAAAGNTGTVVIASSFYEAAIQTHELDYFDSMMSWSLIAASASDFVLEIDLTTMDASAGVLQYQIWITDPVPFPQVGTVTRNLSTTATAGFTYLPQFPGFPFFCTTCTAVPGTPYDPVTGTLNAVGSDLLVAPDIPSLIGFSRAGDLRLSESVPVGVPALPVPVSFLLAGALIGAARASLTASPAAARASRLRQGPRGVE